jgi:hypothetical protein
MTTATELLDHPPLSTVSAPPELFGFGGLHGGLGLALLTASMARHVDGRPLRSVVGHFLRPMREELKMSATLDHAGGTSTVVSGSIVDPDGRPSLSAVGTFGRSGPTISRTGVPRPPVPPPHHCPSYALPTELVPFGASVDLRPATAGRPFANGDEPELMAWIRLVGDDRPVDVMRLIMLLDALAPSYSAVLTEVALLPTVQLAVHPSDGLLGSTSPWLLVRAATTSMSADGWCHESLDAWTPDGIHVGGAEQVRLLLAA